MRKLSPGTRKLLLVVHILFSGILLGCTVAFAAMDIAVLAGGDESMLEACYRIMHLLAGSSLRASTIGSVASGVLLSALTPWGLLRYRWIVAKELLSLAVLALGLFGIYRWSLRGLNRVAAEGADALSSIGYRADERMLAIGLALQLLSLVLLYLLSVCKPWGPVRKGKGKRMHGKSN